MFQHQQQSFDFTDRPPAPETFTWRGDTFHAEIAPAYGVRLRVRAEHRATNLYRTGQAFFAYGRANDQRIAATCARLWPRQKAVVQ